MLPTDILHARQATVKGPTAHPERFRDPTE
jgi:hypothetical protein